MSNKVGINVSLGLDTGKFQAGLDKSRAQMKRFSEQAKKSGGALRALGMGGAGKGLGNLGSVLGVGGAVGGGAGVLLGFVGMAKAVRLTVAAIASMNDAVLNARKTMADFGKDGKFDPTKMGFATKAAASVFVNPAKRDQASEVFASRLKPKTLEDAAVSFAVSSIPAMSSAVIGEAGAVVLDALLGTGAGNFSGRLSAAAGGAMLGGSRTAGDIMYRQLDEQRRIAEANQRMADDFNQLLRGY